MDKETETTINRLLADNKAAHDLVDYLTKKNKQLREALWDLEQYVSRADHFYLKPETLAALKEGE